MTIEPLDPGALDGILRRQHVDNILEDTQRILAARVCGCPAEEIAGRMNLSVPAVYRAIKEVQLAIFRPYGLKRDGWATSRWFGYHAECCVAFGAGLIETSRIFSREKGNTGQGA